MENIREKFERVKIRDLCSAFVMICAIPQALILKWKRPSLWLVCEDYNEARDNGYWLYKYVREEHPEQDIVYAINKKSVDYNKVKNLGEVIQYGGYKHWVYYLAADKNISSQKGGKPNAAVCYVLEVYNILKNKRVFLQHGITINNVTWCHYKNTKMRLFICGAKKEYEYVKKTFGYPIDYVQYVGFARFDGLHNCEVKKNQILVMPTWREWIIDKTSKAYQLDDMTSFKTTEYFQKWNEFLNSSKVAKILEENNLKMIFYPHRNMQANINDFSKASDNIIIADWKKYDVQKLLKESALLITDYSSVCMDFGYMKKPMIYYQFDQKKFREGQYEEGYFDYEKDGFGPTCVELKDVEYELERIVKNKLVIDDIYLQKEIDFFPLWDTDNCKRNYESIKKIR